MPKAAIDIGSNSVLLTVLDDDQTVLHDEARVVALGRGLGDRGLFLPDRIAAAEAALLDYVRTAEGLGIPAWQIHAVATSAARRAMNAETWFSRLMSRTGLRVKIISGEEEARLTWLGALQDLTVPDGPVLVVDLGGGSTELVCGVGATVQFRVSLELGSVRLTEQFLHSNSDGFVDASDLARLRNHVGVELARANLEPHPTTVIGVAGSVTTLMATQLGLATYDSTSVHNARLTRGHLMDFTDRLLASSSAERRAIFRVSPERADTLLAATIILDQVLAVARRPALTVSDRGLRFGLLH